MKRSALILGIIGGLIGLFVCLVAPVSSGGVGISGMGVHVVVPTKAHTVVLGCLLVFFSLVVIIGGALAMRYSKIASIMMLVSAIGGLILIHEFYIIACIFLLAGGSILAVTARVN